MKVANAVAEILKREGIESLIGYPVNPIIEAAAEADIRTIMVRQERIGLHMCDAIAKVTSGDRIGVFAMQHGPGTENAFGGVAQSFGDSLPGRRVAGRLCPQHQPGAPEFQRRAQFPQRHEMVRAGDGRRRDSRGAAPRLYDGQNGRPGPVLVEFPSDLLREEVPDGLVAEYQATPQAQERPRPAIGREDRRGARRGTAPGHRRRAGRPLRQGVAAAEGVGGTARSSGHDDARRQEQVPGKPSAVARLGRHRHRRASLAHAAKRRSDLRHRLQLHPHQLRHGDAQGQEDRARDARPLCESTRMCRSIWPRSAMPG